MHTYIPACNALVCAQLYLISKMPVLTGNLFIRVQSSHTPGLLQADCLEESEVLERKAEMQRLVAQGLNLFTFPGDTVRANYNAAYGLSGSLSGALEGDASDENLVPFQLPFNVVAGNEADTAVHPFWFVRKYRCGAAPLWELRMGLLTFAMLRRSATVCTAQVQFALVNCSSCIHVVFSAPDDAQYCSHVGGANARRTVPPTLICDCCASCCLRMVFGPSRMPPRPSTASAWVPTSMWPTLLTQLHLLGHREAAPAHRDLWFNPILPSCRQ